MVPSTTVDLHRHFDGPGVRALVAPGVQLTSISAPVEDIGQIFGVVSGRTPRVAR